MNRQRLFVSAFLVAAALDTASELLGVHPGFVTKGVPLWLLCALAARGLGGVKGRLLLAGLLIDSIGDIVLALTIFDRAQSLAIGLGLFLVGHLFYGASFLLDRRFRASRLAPAAAVGLVAVGMAGFLAPHLGALKGPVLAYIAVISAMAVLAAFRRPDSLAVPIGAALFVLSDGLLAVKIFVRPIPLGTLWVLITYYAAQFLIVTGSARDAATDLVPSAPVELSA